MHLGGFAVLSAVREVQVPLLSVLLVGGCAAKARRAIESRSIAAGLGPTAMFPLRLRRPVAIFMCSSELSLGVALMLTAGRAGAGLPANAIRAATALLFLTAVGALYELRTRRPDAGCGCFGDLSDTPVGLRTITRSALLSVAAVTSIGVPPLRMPAATRDAGLLLVCAAVEVAIVAALSPELAEILVRLGYSEPCEVRRVPVERTLAALRSSAPWRRYRRQIAGSAPSDIWREGCWRFVVYPGSSQDGPVDIVFAVYLQARRPTVRAAVLDARTPDPLRRAAPHPAQRPHRAQGPHPAPVTQLAPVARRRLAPAPVLSAPVPDLGASFPSVNPPPDALPRFTPASRRPTASAVADTPRRHAGFVRIIRPHTGTHQNHSRHSGAL